MTRTVDDQQVHDQQVIDLLAHPPNDVPDVLRLLEGLQVLADQRAPRFDEDGVACFTYLYHEITKEVWQRLEAGDVFRDSQFLARLDVEFARCYFDAVRLDAAGQPTPRSWKVLFDRRGDKSIDPLQFAVAGVNAHVNFDLAFALVRTCEGMQRILGGTERADYNAINAIFADHMSQLRRHFENRFERVLDLLVFDPLFDGAGDLSVVLSRDAAWRRAEHLWALRNLPNFGKERAALDWRVGMVGRALLALPGL